MQFWQVISGIFKAVFYAISLLIFFIYIAQTAASTSRLFVALLWLTSFVFLVAERYFVKHILGHFKLLQLPVLIMGAGKTAAIVLEYFKKDTGISYDFIGYLEDNTPEASVAAMMPHLGRFEDAEAVIRQTGVQHVMVIAPGLSSDAVQDIVYRVQPLVKKVAFIPDMGSLPLATLDTESLIDGHIVSFSFRNNLALWYNRAVKRVFDVVCTSSASSACRRSFWPLPCGFIRIRRDRLSSSIAASAGTAKNSTVINSAVCASTPT